MPNLPQVAVDCQVGDFHKQTELVITNKYCYINYRDGDLYVRITDRVIMTND